MLVNSFSLPLQHCSPWSRRKKDRWSTVAWLSLVSSPFLRVEHDAIFHCLTSFIKEDSATTMVLGVRKKEVVVMIMADVGFHSWQNLGCCSCISATLYHSRPNTQRISEWTMACTPSLETHRSPTRSANHAFTTFTATLKMRLAMDDRQIKNLQKKASAWMSNLSNEPIETAWVVIARSGIHSVS